MDTAIFFARHAIRVEELEYHISTCEYKDMIRQDTEEGGDKMFYARSISVFWVLFLACTVLRYPRDAQVGCVRPIGSYWTRLEFPRNETTRENFIFKIKGMLIFPAPTPHFTFLLFYFTLLKFVYTYRIVSATGEENRTMSQLIFNPNKY